MEPATTAPTDTGEPRETGGLVETGRPGKPVVLGEPVGPGEDGTIWRNTSRAHITAYLLPACFLELTGLLLAALAAVSPLAPALRGGVLLLAVILLGFGLLLERTRRRVLRRVFLDARGRLCFATHRTPFVLEDTRGAQCNVQHLPFGNAYRVLIWYAQAGAPRYKAFTLPAGFMQFRTPDHVRSLVETLQHHLPTRLQAFGKQDKTAK